MKKLKYERLLLALLVAGGLTILSGCESGVCKNGSQPLTGAWVEKKLPVIEGAEVCFCDEKKIGIILKRNNNGHWIRSEAKSNKEKGWQFHFTAIPFH